MDWLIWVIVIVLVIAVAWWLVSRNNSRKTAATPPAATEPSNTSSVPETAAAAAGVAGLAGVTTAGREPAEASRAGAPESEAVETNDPDLASNAPAETIEPAEPTIENEPVIEAPVLDEPVVDEPVVDTNAKVDSVGVGSAGIESTEAGDVDDWEAAPGTGTAPSSAGTAAATGNAEAPDGVTADDVTRADTSGRDSADKAEWESSWTDSSGKPVHHHEYTDPHSPTLPGAETAAAEGADTDAPSGHLAADHPYGVGSAGAAADGSAPDGYPVKGDAATMTYHDDDSAGYADAPADVWFESPAHAEAAGFRAPRRNRR
jgi:hypothetical protein